MFVAAMPQIALLILVKRAGRSVETRQKLPAKRPSVQRRTVALVARSWGDAKITTALRDLFLTQILRMQLVRHRHVQIHLIM